MPTLPTQTVAVTIDAPFDQVVADLADVTAHPQWATSFFTSPAEPLGDGIYRVDVPHMGGSARVRVDAEPARGVIDMYLAPEGAPFGPPLPIRVVPNGDGADVLFTLSRFPDIDDRDWEEGLDSMRQELELLKARHESRSLP